MPRIDLFGTAKGIDPDVLLEVVGMRLFLCDRLGPAPFYKVSATEGECFRAARFVALSLDALQPGRWSDWGGDWRSDRRIARRAATAPDDRWEEHGFALSGDGIVVDITADQFGHAEVRLSDNSDGRYRMRYRNHGSEGRGNLWARQWLVERATWLDKATAIVSTALSPVT